MSKRIMHMVKSKLHLISIGAILRANFGREGIKVIILSNLASTLSIQMNIPKIYMIHMNEPRICQVQIQPESYICQVRI